MRDRGRVQRVENGDRGRLAIAVAVVAVGTSAILIMYASSGPLTISFYRLLFTTLMLVPWVLLFEREALARLQRADLLRLAAVGLVLALHFSLWIASVKLTSVANSVVLVTTHPLFVAAISATFLGERSPRYALLGGVVAGTGVLVMFAGDLSTGGLLGGVLGDLLAFGGAIAAGIYIVAGRSERRKLPTGTYCVVVYAFTALFLLPGAFWESHLVPAAALDWPLFLAMAAVPGILGHTLYNYALGHVSAFVVSASLLGEPVLSSLLAAVLFVQLPPALSIVGIPLVLGGIVLAAWASGNRAAG
ncbi:MAG: DMT family transporter [Euryarchaeota archaeon]|nr:DMT family transporter [Euryarchaeota archaeon]